jgi:hypothetical protein
MLSAISPIPAWALICKRCGRMFKHCEIPDSLANHFFPQKPEIPEAGVPRDCPHCDAKFIYHLSDLRYQAKNLTTQLDPQREKIL